VDAGASSGVVIWWSCCAGVGFLRQLRRDGIGRAAVLHVNSCAHKHWHSPSL
jgi:hypothetical protein